MLEADSVHSTPPTNTCQIIEFAEFARRYMAREDAKPAKKVNAMARYRREQAEKHAAKMQQIETAPETMTATGRNAILRHDRWVTWRERRRLTNYWRARLDWEHALEIAQEFDVGDSNSFAKHGYEQAESAVLVDLWRVALIGQMLTPAPDLRAVEWKRAELRKRHHRFVATVTEAQLQQSIADDVAWLAAHPVRKSKLEAKRRLADEYDAAQERGEVNAHGGDRKTIKFESSKLEIVSPTELHEARLIRNAEQEA